MNPTVILIGFGYAGRCFYNNLDKSKFEIKVILDCDKIINKPYFLDSLKNNSIKNVIYNISDNKNFRLNEIVISVDYINKKILTFNKTYHEYFFDYLVIGIGTEINTYQIPGVIENCNFFSSYHDLERAREISNDTKYNIGIIGCSLAGLELATYFADVHKIDIFDYSQIFLPSMSFSIRTNVLNFIQQNHNIKLHLGNQLMKIEKIENQKKLYVKSNNVEKEYIYDIVFWVAGTQPNKNMYKWFNTNKVNSKLKIENTNDIFAIGDCNNFHIKSAQCAKSQGLFLAEFFNSNFSDNLNFEYINNGTIIKLNSCVYVENNYYSGFAPNFIHSICHYINNIDR